MYHYTQEDTSKFISLIKHYHNLCFRNIPLIISKTEFGKDPEKVG